MQDTSVVQRDRYIALLRAQMPYERLQRAVSLSGCVRTLAEACLRLRYPESSVSELRVRLAVRLYGRSVAQLMFAVLPDDSR